MKVLFLLVGAFMVAGCLASNEPEDVETVSISSPGGQKTSAPGRDLGCWSSCKVAWKQIELQPVTPEEAKTLFDVKDGYLQIFNVQSEDGREFVVSAEEFNALAEGDSISLCTRNPCQAGL